MVHHYTIDLESWTHSPAIFKTYPSLKIRKKMDNDGCQRQIYAILKILQQNKTKVTWFIVAEIYEWYPKAIEDIASEGHEIALHTFSHRTITSVDILKDELYKSKNFIRKFNIKGFRPPEMRLPSNCYSVLDAEKFSYTSSTYSSKRSFYIGDIKEVPVSALSLNETNPFKTISRFLTPYSLESKIPFGSGIFIGAFGSRILCKFINAFDRKNMITNLFIHSWQIINEGEAAQMTRMKILLKNPFFAPYLRNTKEDFIRIIARYRFKPIRNNF